MAQSDPVDLSHHLSDVAKSIKPNPLKVLYKYRDIPGLVKLAGFPPASLFPYETMSADVLLPTAYPVKSPTGLVSWLWSIFSHKPATSRITIPKYAGPDDGPSALQLSTALQYSLQTGLPAFEEFVHDFTLQVFEPAYPNFHVLATSGNTDGWTKACTILCQHGEFILTEDWSFPGALLAAWSLKVRPYAVPTDGLGMIPEELERILVEWKEEDHDGKRRPHVMYTIPVGQNPTGAIMDAKRKQEIYNICVKFDIIIVEDDPYYFLQFPEYKRKSERSLGAHIPGPVSSESSKKFIDTLADSGTIGPGCRLGWITANALFATVMDEYGSSTTNQTSGISQAMVIQLVSKHWGYEGYVRWLRGIGVQYTEQRNFLVDCVFETSSLGLRLVQGDVLLQGGVPIYEAYTKVTSSLCHNYNEKPSSHDKPLFTFTIPTSGMFLWVDIYLKHHRDWIPHPAPGSPLEVKLWNELVDGGVLFAPGYIFSTDEGSVPGQSSSEAGPRSEYTHMRICFSNATKGDMKEGMNSVLKHIVSFHNQELRFVIWSGNAMSVLLETSLGDLVIDLEVDTCPRTCENFLKLCKIYYYNLHAFFNVTKDFVAQVGDPTATGTGGESALSYIASKSDPPTPNVPRYFAPELVPHLKHTSKGTVSMAIAPGLEGGCGSQFFITLADNIDYLDGKHAVFGHVVEGLETLDQLNEVYTDQDGRPMKDVRIRHVVILDDPFPDPPGLVIPDEAPTKAPDLKGTNVRIGEDEDPLATLPEEEAEKQRRERAAAASALTLEMVGDLPFANVRPPENVLFVCKLNPVTRDEDLELIFSRFGVIMSCQIIRDKKTGDSLQYAFIEFDKREDAEQAYFKMQNVLVDDRRIWVDFSQSVSKLNTSWSNNPKMPKRGARGGGGFAGREDLEATRRYREEDSGPGSREEFGMVFDHSSRVREERSRSQSPARRDRYRRSEDRDDYRDRDRHRGGGRDRDRDKDRDRDSRRDKDRDRDRDWDKRDDRHRDRERDRDRRRY
ncbi:Peptidyl-prolyl cis-trans isomerase-like 4 [Ceratobasidium theobromae]|uniref:peptidylprolyl isomerase n=1 Tax=Ceratobasidium theobromae TaxID=1582974 RepID=A0A5N5QUH9_9AGAM|nr:Peptidyl-prolyl cis-trans isomerase-like 4 [Ceratobasidium theobromae]